MNKIREMMRRLGRKDLRTLAIVDMLFGDGGKGKFVDWLGEWADIIARGTGGANAGHTIKLGGQTHIFHLLPSGILWDKYSKTNVIGRGMAVDPRTLAQELQALKQAGLSYNHLLISHQARLVTPMDIALDLLKEAASGAGAIGTTGRGIGPLYESQVARIGLVVNDLLNQDILIAKLKRNLQARLGMFKQYDLALVAEVLNVPALESGLFAAGPETIFNVDAIVAKYLEYARVFRLMIARTDLFMAKAVGKQNILLEGAQGVLLSVDYGSYPYVTSSDCSLAGLAKGVDLDTSQVDYVLGVTKAPYMTRVGNGPFPTELGGNDSAIWCGRKDINKEKERTEYLMADINATDPFEQGIAIRRAGDEYGATTGRLRRVGWLDLPLLRWTVKYGLHNKGGLALTKPDVMNGCQTIRVCVQHRYEGDAYYVGEQLLLPGTLLDTAVMDSHVLARCTPVYQELPGWTDLQDPDSALAGLLNFVEEQCHVTIDVVSVGADRNAIVVL